MKKLTETNEKKLRKQILEALKKTDGVINAEFNHGVYEFGIDIVFDFEDAFGRKRKYGIQVKAGDISGPDLSEILGQLSVAFGHEFSIDPSKFLDAVYVVTDGEFIGGAKEFFKKANVGFRNVFLINGARLKPYLELKLRGISYKEE